MTTTEHEAGNHSDLATLLGRHSKAVSRRSCAQTRGSFDVADAEVAELSARIAEHIVREEVDVGAYSFDQA